MNDADRDELRTLFAGMHDGRLSEADHARLERLLAESAEARRLWFLHCDIETGLADWAASRESNAALPKPAPEVHRWRNWSWLAPLAAAAAVIFGAFVWWPRTPAAAPAESPAYGVAVLAREVGVAWADGQERAAGSVLAPGPLKLSAGAALVEFYGGARVVVEGPAELRLMTAGEVELIAGKINAHVPTQAHGFTVLAAGAKVVDHGTDFGVIVNGAAPSEVHVFTGEVEVSRAGNTPRIMHEDEAVRIERDAFAAIPSARPAFLSEEELARRDLANASERFARWREASGMLSDDAGAVVHYLFDDADGAQRRLANHGTGAAPDGGASIIGGAWTEGRWPGKRALEFRGEGDRVRLSASSPKMTAVTLLAWVRVEALPRWQNVLLSADSEQPGALRWHLTQHGELRLEIARDLGRPQVDWEAVNSAPFVTPDRFGQWLLLATTFDGTTIRHYGNGQLIGSGASFTPPELHIGTAELGNWRGGTQRHLAAAMDEFAILSRAMGAEEIRAVYQAGK